jgi:nitrate reductase delta subunit
VIRASRQQVAATRQAAALLLAYPDDMLLERLPMLSDVLDALPADLGDPLRRLADHLGGAPLLRLQKDYVETFDLRARCCLYLTWWTHGDTRERGKALVGFKEIYRAAGLTPPADELPDHLCVVLEFAAIGDERAGGTLLAQHRAALELVHDSLRKRQSPYAAAVEALLATLPPAGADVRETVRRIARTGPPREQVGLEPYPAGGKP